MTSTETRVTQLARWFGAEAMRRREPARRPPAEVVRAAHPAPGSIVLLTGPSGGGKSTLLRRVVASARRRGQDVLDVSRLRMPNRPLVDCLANLAMDEAVGLLARLGLAEAALLARRPRRISVGQRLRARLAVAVARCRAVPGGTLLALDEFAAVLDRVTAALVARTLRRAIDSLPAPPAVLLATSHDDLAGPLDPDVTIDCDFGKWTVARRPFRRPLTAAATAAPRSTAARAAVRPAASPVASRARRGASNGSAPAWSAPPRGDARGTACRFVLRRSRSVPPASAFSRTRRRGPFRLPALPGQAPRRGRTPGTRSRDCRGRVDGPSGSCRKRDRAWSARSSKSRRSRFPSRSCPVRHGSNDTARVRPSRSRRSVPRSPGK